MHDSPYSSDDDEADDTTPVSDDGLFDYVNEHVSCFAHTLQLVIKDGFKQAAGIDKVLAKTSAIVTHVRKSIHASEILECEKRLQSANATRWSSQLAMVRSILPVPEETLLSTQHQLTAHDRNVLKDLTEILTPFESATHCIQGNNVVAGSMVVPCVRVLKGELEQLSYKYNSPFVKQLKASVQKRLSPYETHDAFLTASALDPRFKLQWCTQEERIIRRSDLITKAVAIAHNDSATVTAHTNEGTTDEPPPSKKRRGFFSTLIETAENPVSSTTGTESYIDDYLTSPCMTEDTDPLSFWKLNENKYPALAKLAPIFLCIPASSAPVERLFSIAGKVFHPERCRLTDNTFQQLMFLRCNSGK